jgi:Holliday junction resolvasome RuvABC endonuclease subunit
MRIMGIDGSLSTVAVAIVDNGKLDNYSYYKPPKDGALVDRVIYARDWVRAYVKNRQPDTIVIEDYIRYLGGGSGAATVIPLAILNCSIQIGLKDIGYDVHTINVNTVRARIKEKTRPKKEEIPELVAKKLGIKFPWVYKKNGSIAAESYDIADAIAVAISAIPLKKQDYLSSGVTPSGAP